MIYGYDWFSVEIRNATSKLPFQEDHTHSHTQCELRLHQRPPHELRHNRLRQMYGTFIILDTTTLLTSCRRTLPIYIYILICMYACMHVCMHACMHVCMYVYISLHPRGYSNRQLYCPLRLQGSSNLLARRICFG